MNQGSIKRRVVLICTVFYNAYLCAENTLTPSSGDLSTRGVLTVETYEFANLSDTNRPSIETSPQHRRPLRDLFSQSTPDKNDSPRHRRPLRDLFSQSTPDKNERKVPIKIHAPAGTGPFPIVIVSHGAGGNWDTHYAQAQHLASHGYMVLCLEHVGSNTDRMKQGIRLMDNINRMIRDANEVLGRPEDVSFAIDRATEWNESHEKLRGRFDLKRIGVIGHSFGAFTTMAVCGMRPALDWLEPSVPPGKGLGPDLHDTRVTCGVALSPQGADEPFFIRESFASLRTPLLAISGTEDKQQGGLPPLNRYQSFALWPESQGRNKFIWLANAHHLDFTDSEGAEQHGLRSATRNEVQPTTKAATLLFFNIHLKGDAHAEQLLTTNGLKPYLRGSVNSVEVRSK